MLFEYKIIDTRTGEQRNGKIDSFSKDSAISSLQARGYTIISIKGEDDKAFWEKDFHFGSGVSDKELVILTKQLSILFTAQVSALKIFRMMSEEMENKTLKEAMMEIATDISDGSSLTMAMSKHSDIFSSFYINMVGAGEEAGKLSQTFQFLADYMERSNALTSKAKSAMIYPAVVSVVFVVVMYIMLTTVIPKISAMLDRNGQDLPTSTKIVLALSDFFVNYGLFFIVVVIFGGFMLARYIKTDEGKRSWDEMKIKIPLIKKLFVQVYAARVAGNLEMLLKSGVSMVKSIDNTATVVDNKFYEDIILNVGKDVRNGESLSMAFAKYKEHFPGLLIQMMKVGEESGRITDILGTMAKFYEKEVEATVKTLVTLIEPLMIVLLGGSVGGLIAAVITPIFNVTASL